MIASNVDFGKALASLQAGKLDAAEQQFRKTLRRDPKHVGALNLITVLLTHQKRYAEAERFVKAALAIDARSDATFYNYGIVLKGLGRPAEALDCFNKALSMNGTIAETWNNCGTALNDLARYDEAIERFDKAIALKSDYADAFYNKGKSLAKLGRSDDAEVAFQRALAINPSMVEAWLASGHLALDRNRSDLAKEDSLIQESSWEKRALFAYRRAFMLKPDLVEAAAPLIRWAVDRGRIDEALDLVRRMLSAGQTQEAKAFAAFCLSSPHLRAAARDPSDLLVRAISEPWGRPAEFAPSCAHFLALDENIGSGISLARKAWPDLPPLGALTSLSQLTAYANVPLLRASFEAAPVYGPALSNFATALRFALLTAARAAPSIPLAAPILDLYCAIARQCFINNYVFPLSEVETEQIHDLRNALLAGLNSNIEIPVLTVVALAAYVPLHTLPDARRLSRRSWPTPVKLVLAQQIDAPLEEQSIRGSIPVLTAIDDAVSENVRSMYEENPYPQWVTSALAAKPKPINETMRSRFPYAPFVDIDHGLSLDVLVAGCGTGQHSVAAAQRFDGSKVLAVDISLSSLSYAKRQTKVLGLTNIEYAQADILKLSALDRRFDVIESCGVLHHLENPFAGWRELLSLLRPGGVMLIGLYSKTARYDVTEARKFIVEQGYAADAAGIRQCRQHLLAFDDDTPFKRVTSSSDFYSLSGCRDLLFHVQEYCMDLSQIEQFLTENNLALIGFELSPHTEWNYKQRFSDDLPMTNLAHWRRYESENPYTFLGMYEFWVQKK